MKKFYLILLALIAFSAFSASAQAFPSDTLEKAQGQLIIHGNNFSLVDYALEDGTKLNQKDLNELLETVPGNDVFLKKAKGWRITGYSSLGLAAVAWGTNLVYALVGNLPGENIVVPVTAYTAIGTSLFGVMALELGAWNQMKAVDNYNVQIRVMGVPVN
ncbi:MAG: hypothetical protein IKR40_00865 [Treponema sp.]|nr:hypothetical protein [Treponema sp.]